MLEVAGETGTVTGVVRGVERVVGREVVTVELAEESAEAAEVTTSEVVVEVEGPVEVTGLLCWVGSESVREIVVAVEVVEQRSEVIDRTSSVSNTGDTGS